jgi:DNA-binding phage protein
VEVEGLARALQRFVDAHDAEHLRVQGAVRRDSGAAYLAREAGLHQRQVSRVLKREYPTVALSKAERLLAAAGAEHLLQTGEVTIVRNPRIKPETYDKYVADLLEGTP